MTRSKRKMEMELQMANSKVLRNDKVIRNSMTKIKRKYVRKQRSSQTDGKGSVNIIGTRLRSQSKNNTRKCYVYTKRAAERLNRTEEQKKQTSVAQKSKNKQTDLYLEVYRYKRSLKVPPSLISIKHPTDSKMPAADLPDLEKESTVLKEEEQKDLVPNKKKVGRPSSQAVKEQQQKTESVSAGNPQFHRSIIDLLHSRVTSASNLVNTPNNTASQKVKPKQKLPKSRVSSSNETSQTGEISLGDLLPTPKKEPSDSEENEEGKKRHFSIFDTKVLKSKTRNASKLQQKKEIIREIFVGDDLPHSPEGDRPASAPPEMTQTGGLTAISSKMTYEQKYEQFLAQMNAVTASSKLERLANNRCIYTTTFGSNTTNTLSTTTAALQIKVEDDTESAMGDDSMSVKSGTCETSSVNVYRRRRPAKYLRRKGSSGFDYIRKKKKPTSSNSNNNNTAAMSSNSNIPLLQLSQIKQEKSLGFDEFMFKTKTEDDVGREIQKWVLNKGVGQSAMHKAARLGYIDVVVYCLERLAMNPDQKDNAGYTPLHEACTNGFLEIARVLLEYGANHSEAAHSGIRPLHEASENDHEELVRLLLSYGCDPLLATYSGKLFCANSKCNFN